MLASRPNLIAQEYAGPERRSAFRAKLEAQAFVTSRHRKYVCAILDVSAAGMGLRLDSLDLLERLVMVEFFLPGVSRWQKLHARVVRAGRCGDGITWGLAFCDPDARVAARIEGYVSALNGG